MNENEIINVDPSGTGMKEFIDRICSEIGPRICGTDSEIKAGEIIATEMENYCDSVEKQKYSCRPGGFLDYIWVTAIFYIIGVISYYFVPIVSVIAILLGLLVYFVQQNVLWEVVDFLYPKKESYNIIGKIKPKSEIKQLVLLSGHHDSAYEFPLLNKLGDKSMYLIILTVTITLLNMLVGLVRTIINDSSLIATIDLVQTLLFTIGVPILIIFAFFLRTNTAVMGANDNLSAVATVMETGRLLSKNKPESTEVWIVSFSGEENMRASKRFVKKNYEELKNKNSMLFNFEVLSGDEFLLATSEPFFLAKHSEKVIKNVEEAARNIELPIRVEGLPFAGSDAANFSRKGLDAAVLFGIVNGGLFPHWHSVEDTAEKIDGKALAKVVELALEFVRVVDQNG